jgi:hypothetical protein
MQNLQEGDDAGNDMEYDALTDDDESVQMTRSTSSQNCRSGTPRPTQHQRVETL